MTFIGSCYSDNMFQTNVARLFVSPAELNTTREDIYTQGVSGKNAHIQRKCGPELTDYLFNVTKKEKGSSSSREYIYASKSNVLISDNHMPLL